MEQSVRKGSWTAEEDEILTAYVERHGEGKWNQVPERAGLNRCRKSCRMRWLNYLKPSIKRGKFMEDEVDLMLRLHKLLGNRWSLIAGRLPGRTANDVKNYWNTNHKSKDRVRTETKPHPETYKHTANVIKPRPWNFKNSFYAADSPQNNRSRVVREPENHGGNAVAPKNECSSSVEEDQFWWEYLLSNVKLDDVDEDQLNIESLLPRHSAGGDGTSADQTQLQDIFLDADSFSFLVDD